LHGNPGPTKKENAMKTYVLTFTIDSPLDDVIEHARGELQRRHFRMLHELDIDDMVPGDLNPAEGAYRILLVTHPGTAFLALRRDRDMGTMLVWSIVFSEEEGHTRIAMIRPTIAERELATELRGGCRAVENALARILSEVKVEVEHGVIARA